MEIALQFVLLALGFVMLGKGADWFVEGAAGIAMRFGIPQLVIGLTIVAMGHQRTGGSGKYRGGG